MYIAVSCISLATSEREYKIWRRFSDWLSSYEQIGVSVNVGDRFKFQVTGNNLTNEIGLTEGNPRIIGSQGSGPILARPILGRSFRFSAAVSF